MRLAVIAVVALSGCAGAQGRCWSTTDKVLETTLGAVMLIDAAQTIGVAADCKESNPLIGHCGGNVPPAAYFAGLLAIHAAITHAIPHGTARTVWQAFGVGYQVDVIGTNWSAGYRLGF